MSTTEPSLIRDFLRRLVSDPQVATCADRELLGRFLTGKDEAAFEAIVRRHGPMVFDVCRNMLANAADAEDAFQATFLILVRKAVSIRDTTSLASWLHGVAYRTACQARTDFARRRRHEARGAAREPSEAADELSWREAQAVVHQELAGLADRYRSPLVLCYLEGKTQEEAAAELGIAKSTLRERMDRGRSLLRVRLAKRGFGPVALLLAAAWPAAGRSAHVPITLASETLKVTSSGGSAAAGRVIELTHGVLHAMKIRKTVASVAATLSAVAFVGFILPALVGPLVGPASGLPVAAGAPGPNKQPDAGLIWTHNTKANTLVAYTPDGKEAKTVRLPEGVPFLGFTPDGTRMAFAGKDGKGNAGPDGLTLHVGDVSEKCEGTDTGLGCLPNDQFVWSPDRTKVVRSRPEQNGIVAPGGGKVNPPAFSHVLFDLATKKESPIDLPTDHQLMQWSADGKAWRVLQYNLGADPNLPNYRWLTTPAGGKPDLKPLCDTHSFLWLEPGTDGKGHLGVGWKHVANGGAPSQGLFRVADGKAEELATLDGVAFVVVRRSPDGKRVVCVKYEFDAQFQKLGDTVFVLFDADGSNETKLHTAAGDAQATRLLGWFPSPPAAEPKAEPPGREPIKAPVPKGPEAEWKEGKPIKLEDGGRVVGVAYSPDGKAIAIVQSGRATVLDAATRKVRFAVDPTNPARITAATFSPKGDRLAVTRKDAVDVYRADGEGKAETWELTGFDPHRVAWAADPDGGEHLVATNGAETRHRDAKGKEHTYPGWAIWKHQPCVLTGVPGKPSWLMQFDDGGMDRDMTDVWVWNPADGRKSRRLTGHKYRPDCGAASGDGAVVVTGYGARHLVVWDGGSGKKVAEVPVEGGVVAVAVAPDGKTVAVLEATSTPVKPMPPGAPDTDPANWRTALAVTLFATADLAASDREAPKPLLRWATDTPLLGFTRWPGSLAFSSDGKTLLAAFADPYDDPKAESLGVRVWELVPKR